MFINTTDTIHNLGIPVILPWERKDPTDPPIITHAPTQCLTTCYTLRLSVKHSDFSYKKQPNGNRLPPTTVTNSSGTALLQQGPSSLPLLTTTGPTPCSSVCRLRPKPVARQPPDRTIIRPNDSKEIPFPKSPEQILTRLHWPVPTAHPGPMECE